MSRAECFALYQACECKQCCPAEDDAAGPVTTMCRPGRWDYLVALGVLQPADGDAGYLAERSAEAPGEQAERMAVE